MHKVMCILGCEASKSSCASSCASESSCKAFIAQKVNVHKKKYVQSWKDEGLKYEGEVADEFDLIVVGSGPGGYLACWNGW